MIRSLRRPGFTLIEMIIVTIAIAILATIIITTYNGAQAKARDARRMSDLSSIADAITSYRLKYGDSVTYPSCSGGLNTSTSTYGTGWFNESGTASYTTSILSCLTAKNYLQNNPVDPSGCADMSGTSAPGYTCNKTPYAYEKSTCSVNGQTVTILLAKLETQGSTSNLTGANALCDSATWAASPYYMNYMVRVD